MAKSLTNGSTNSMNNTTINSPNTAKHDQQRQQRFMFPDIDLPDDNSVGKLVWLHFE